MRVLHYVDENRLAWMEPWLQLLGELRTQGVENIVLCKPGGTLSSRVADCGFEVFVHKPLAQWLPIFSGEVGRIIDRVRPDLIHTRLSAAARIGGYWARRKNILVVGTIDKYPRAKYYRNVDAIVGCSSEVSRHMLSIGFSEDRVNTIHNPVELDRYREPEGERFLLRRKMDIPDDTFVILGAGRLVDGKGWDIFLRSCAKFKSFRKLAVWLVGDGLKTEELKSMSRELGLDDVVSFHGFARDIRPWLWAADLFVQPSTRPEGFSLMLLEAMAAGLPVIATSIGGTLDIVEDGVNGWMVEPGNIDALAEVIEKARLFDSLSEVAHRAEVTSKKYGVRRIAEDYLNLYQRMCLNG